MPPKKRSAYTKSKGDDEQPQVAKRPKTSSSAPTNEAGKKFVDSEGNPYWELGGRLRRVTISEFKGKHLISIREHYEKDGKVLPGKKGISMSVEQFDTLLSVLPQLDNYLAEKDISLTRPVYGLTLPNIEYEEEQEQEGEDKDDEKMGETHEDEEVEEEEEEVVKPKKKPVKTTKASQKKPKKKAAEVGSDEE